MTYSKMIPRPRYSTKNTPIGKSALKFIDFLKECGFTYWQVLPFCTTDRHNSPYMSYSSIGGNMFFKKTSTYETHYNAMGGLSLDMKIFTTNLDILKEETGISAKIDYQLFLAGSSVGKMGMDIKVEYI